jgi:predicted nucleic acid-binding protein
MIVLDTNVLSALMRAIPAAEVVAWLDAQPRSSIWTTSISVLEISFGLQVMASGRRRTALIEAFDGLMENLDYRVAEFDTDAAQRAAALMATRQKKGRPGDLRDTMIAGIVLSRRATLATGNTVHFQDACVPLLNPWKS